MEIAETLEHLSALQGIDDGIKALNAELELLPKRLESARHDEESVKEKYEAAQTGLEAELKHRRDLEGEISTAEQNVIKFENDKLKVKTNEEFRALNNQIAQQKQKKSELEDQVLASLDEEETAATLLGRLQEELKVVQATTVQRREELEERSKEDRKQLEELKTRREEALPRIEAQILFRYEQVRRNKNGSAVVRIAKGACGGCYTQQPPQRVNEVRKRDRVHQCEFCGRFLVWQESAEA